MLLRGSLTQWICAIWIAASCSSSGEARADADRERGITASYLGILVGGGIASYREDLIVPISFDGPAFFLGGQYAALRERTAVHLRLRIGTAVLENRYGHEAYAATLELRPSWVTRLAGRAHSHELWGGVSIPLRMTNLFPESWDDAHLYWFTSYSLALAGEYHSSLPWIGYSVLRLELPLVGLVSRPPEYRYEQQEPISHWTYHFTGPNSAFVAGGIWDYQSPLLQIMMRRVSQGALFHLGLEFELDHGSGAREVWGLNTRLVFAYLWRIG